MFKRPASLFRKGGREGSMSRLQLGRIVADSMDGSWRSGPVSKSVSVDAWGEISRLLIASGAGGLGWCRVRESAMNDAPFARELHQAYRYQSLQSALHHRNLKQVIPLLRSAGVEPVLVKGWAIARLYPELGMRPYSDLDLCVTAAELARAENVLKRPEMLSCDVDLHVGFGKF